MKDWLSRIEQDFEIDILFACEAGSRAWGLATPDSDFDIRFIYRYRGLKRYLALNKATSSLDFQSPFDASGYDIFKAFTLLAKSNPSIYEWAYSPLIYIETSEFALQLKKVIKAHYSPYSLFKHYGSLTKRNVNELAKGTYTLKKQKQLLQAIRAELIRIGILITKSAGSPFELIEMAKSYHPNLFAAYLTISEAKRNNDLLTPSESKRMISLLEISFKGTEDQNEITKTVPSLDILDKWIWEIFGIS